jgi:hypothetical protein
LPGETVFRDPRNTYHHITLGAVLAAYAMDAHHARRLDGLLSMDIEQAQNLLGKVASLFPSEDKNKDVTVGEFVSRLLDHAPAALDDLGRFAEWRRAFEKYMERTEPFLSGMTGGDLEKLAGRPVSRAQSNLVRTTCAHHRIEYPALANRLAAFEWLRDVGANLRFREWR